MQISGRKPGQPGASPVLRQRVPGVQCAEVGLETSPCSLFSSWGAGGGRSLARVHVEVQGDWCGIFPALNWSDRPQCAGCHPPEGAAKSFDLAAAISFLYLARYILAAPGLCV